MAGGTGSPSLDLNTMLIPSGPIYSSVTSVGTNAAVSLIATPLEGRCRVYAINMSTPTVYIGHNSVTANTGFPLLFGTPMPLPIGPGVMIYGIAAGGLTSIRLLEMS